MDIQNQDLHASRHAYRTADYQVSKQEMASLWRRYYIWSAYRNKSLQVASANVGGPRTSSKSAQARRAYHSGVVATHSGNKPPHSARSSRHAYRMLHEGVHKPGETESKRHAYESGCNYVHLTVS